MSTSVPAVSLHDESLAAEFNQNEWEAESITEYRTACKTAVECLGDGRLTFADIELMHDKDVGGGVFYPYYSREEADMHKAVFKQAQARLDTLRTQVPEIVVNYLLDSWVSNALPEYNLDIRRDIAQEWASRIENSASTLGASAEELLGVVGTLQYLMENYPTHQIRTDAPDYLVTGSLSLWLMKVAGPDNLYLVNKNEVCPFIVSEQAQDALRNWRRPIGDIDVTVGNIPINKKGLFRLNDVNFGSYLHKDPHLNPESPYRNIELRPSMLDMSEYMIADLGGIPIPIPCPEYSLAFKMLQLQQNDKKANAADDLALLKALATDEQKVEKYYMENSILVSTDI